ncbi:MAG: glycosyltransferase [bacterium]
MNKTLILFTDYFPYSKTETFLETEILFLSKAFEKVIICPRKHADSIREMPENIEVDAVLYQSEQKSKISLYFHGVFFIIKSLFLFIRVGFFRNFTHTGTLKSIKYTGLIAVRKGNVKRFLHQRRFDLNTTIFYTYWLGYETLALGLLKNKTKSMKVVSRAHGYDLYNERGEMALNFIKPLNLQLADKIFCISKNGLNYLAERYPYSKEKLFLSYLGTHAPGFTVQPHQNESFKIASCSGIREVKRLDKIIDVLYCLTQQELSISLEWHHLGDGPLRNEMEQLAKKKLTGNIKYYFHGNVDNKKIFQYYQKIQPNLFINLSDSEGLPVSIMETMSVGIPILATDVGGTTEIVNAENGWLVGKKTEPEQISFLLNKIINQHEYIMKGNKAKAVWKDTFSADNNYQSFAQILINFQIA